MQTKSRFQLAARWLCFAVLAFAVMLRMAMQPTVRAGISNTVSHALGSDAAARLMLFLSLGTTQIPEDAPKEAAVEQSAAPQAAPETETYPTLRYTPKTQTQIPQGAVEIRNRSGLEIDLDSLLAAQLPFDASAQGPLVLIIHTHATEAYTIADGDTYEESSSYRTQDTAYNVVRVGQALADTLEARGIETLHDETLNDLPSYDDSYPRMAEVAQSYLTMYPSIQMVIDVHRDALVDDADNQLALTTVVEGEELAQLLLVMGTNASGLTHPNWESNLSCAVQAQAVTEARAPGLFRTMSLRAERYNQHLTPCSLLLEVGTAGNTLQQALRSAELFGEALADLLLQG
ncbi:MAG: stage II sporulation protein P [Oscillospiraceae bacterium]|jgi:stage II sporulation protein P|nr:stage II sporulation protein P [Oscillospiraceae bacterium]